MSQGIPLGCPPLQSLNRVVLGGWGTGIPPRAVALNHSQARSSRNVLLQTEGRGGGQGDGQGPPAHEPQGGAQWEAARAGPGLGGGGGRAPTSPLLDLTRAREAQTFLRLLPTGMGGLAAIRAGPVAPCQGTPATMVVWVTAPLLPCQPPEEGGSKPRGLAGVSAHH